MFAGRPRTKNRGNVEETPRLDIRSFVRGGYFQVGRVTRGTRAWSGKLPDESPETVSIAVGLTDLQKVFADLEFVFRGERCRQTIAVSGALEATTATHRKNVMQLREVQNSACRTLFQ